ncbi:MAG: DNA-binding protein [Acidithiobacillus ferrivorans]
MKNTTPLDYEKVAKAADEVESEGLNATVRSVRQKLGYGSFTTILQFLNQRTVVLRGEIGIDDSIDDRVINAIKENIGNRAMRVLDAANTILAKLRRENFVLAEENASLREELAAVLKLLEKPVADIPYLGSRIADLQDECHKLLQEAKNQSGKELDRINLQLNMIRAELQALYGNIRPQHKAEDPSSD